MSKNLKPYPYLFVLATVLSLFLEPASLSAKVSDSPVNTPTAQVNATRQYSHDSNSPFDTGAIPSIYWINRFPQPRAALLCIHGLGLNKGAYASFGKHMSKLGIATYAIDVRGFGAWMKSEGHDKLDFDGSLADIKQVLQEIHSVNPNMPVFLLGESMGGAIALRACSMYPELISGLISSVPAGQRFQQKRTDLKVALHFVKGRHKDFDIGQQIVGQATQNDKLKQAWETDPLNRMDLSAEDLLQFQKFMSDNHDAAVKIDQTPVLMVQGTLDKLVKPEGTWELFEELATPKKTFIALPSEHLVFEEDQVKSPQYDTRTARLVAAWIFSTINFDLHAATPINLREQLFSE